MGKRKMRTARGFGYFLVNNNMHLLSRGGFFFALIMVKYHLEGIWVQIHLSESEMGEAIIAKWSLGKTCPRPKSPPSLLLNQAGAATALAPLPEFPSLGGLSDE